MVGAKYRPAVSRNDTYAISSSKDRMPISRLLRNLERELLQLTMISITESLYDWLYLFLCWALIGNVTTNFIRTSLGH